MTETLQYKSFSATIKYSEYDKTYYGSVTDIKELVSFEGTNLTQLNNAFIEGIEDYLTLLQELA